MKGVLNPRVNFDIPFQPECQPLVELMRRWKESSQPSIKIPALTQEQFEDLMPEELSALLQGVFVVRDEPTADSL